MGCVSRGRGGPCGRCGQLLSVVVAVVLVLVLDVVAAVVVAVGGVHVVVVMRFGRGYCSRGGNGRGCHGGWGTPHGNGYCSVWMWLWL